MLLMVGSKVERVEAATTTNKESLITKVSNPSNGKITFVINVPAKTTVSYKVELIPNARTKSIDTKSGSYKNTGKSQVSKKITVTTRYYSNKYKITASYSTGPARNRKIYKDTDSAVSALKTTIYTNKFVWNSANIKKWKAESRVQVLLGFAITGAADLAVTKGYLSAGYGTVVSLTFLCGDYSSAGSVSDTKTIQMTPIKGWGFKVKAVPYDGGYTKYLLVYDAKGRLHETIKFGKMSISTISTIIK